MEEGGRTKKTIFVGGIGEDVDEQVILETFSIFGGFCWSGYLPDWTYTLQAISSTFNSPQTQQADHMRIVCLLPRKIMLLLLIFIAADLKHRGYAFVTFSSAGDAQDAIDNMDMNELRGRNMKVSIARPMKGVTPATGNRASESCSLACGAIANEALLFSLGIRGMAKTIR